MGVVFVVCFSYTGMNPSGMQAPGAYNAPANFGMAPGLGPVGGVPATMSNGGPMMAPYGEWEWDIRYRLCSVGGGAKLIS